MASKREKAPSKRMRRIALVICEGKTEESYINLLKKWYKSPIRIVSHIEGTKITQSLIDNRTRELKISPWDRVQSFLMYDMDVPAVNEKLLKCKANLLLSNPCFELWLLLHIEEQKNEKLFYLEKLCEIDIFRASTIFFKRQHRHCRW